MRPYLAFIFLLNLAVMGLIFHLILRRVRAPSTPLHGVTPAVAKQQSASENLLTIPYRKKG